MINKYQMFRNALTWLAAVYSNCALMSVIKYNIGIKRIPNPLMNRL